MAIDYDKADQDIEWIVSAVESPYNAVKQDAGMFELNDDSKAYVSYVIETLEGRGYKVTRAGYRIGVKL